MFVTQAVMAEILRRHTMEGNPVVTVELAAVDTGVSRARAAALFTLCLRLSWGVGVFRVIDQRGYVLTWKFGRVIKWLEKSLSGKPGALVIKINDAKKLPARWTNARRDSLMKKILDINPNLIREKADEKRTSVFGWSDSKRRDDILKAADAMDDLASNLDLVLAGDLPATPDPEPGGGDGEPEPEPEPEPGEGGDMPPGPGVCAVDHEHAPMQTIWMMAGRRLELGVPFDGHAKKAESYLNEDEGPIDWYKVNFVAGVSYWIRVYSFGSTELERFRTLNMVAPCGGKIYDTAEVNVDAEWEARFRRPWLAEASGTYYIRIYQHTDAVGDGHFVLSVEVAQGGVQS